MRRFFDTPNAPLHNDESRSWTDAAAAALRVRVSQKIMQEKI